MMSNSAPADLNGNERPVAVQPSQSPRSGRFEGGGRRIVGSTVGSNPSSPREQRTPRARVQTTEEMDRRIEEDALALINMKREILESQKAEVTKAQQALAAIRKEHDTLHMANELLQKQINAILDRATALENVDKGVKAAGSATQEMCNSFKKQLAEAEEIQAAEQRTLRMQQLMANRLDLEIAELRALSSKATLKLETQQHELVGTASTLIVSKQERGAQEHKLSEMRKNIEALNKERNQKLHMMQSIIDDGEQSLSQVQGSVFDTRSLKARTGTSTRTATREATTNSAEDPEDFEFAEGRPEVLAKRLPVARVEEMVHRYKSRDSAIEKLNQLESELKIKIVAERTKKAELLEKLEDVRARHHTMASSRTKLYKDMDDKATVLWRARKSCDDWHEKDQRLKSNLEAIKRAVPRLLSKLTKTVVPIPNTEDLPDAIQKLEDEVLRVFKATSAAVQKDTPADEGGIAAISQTSATGNGGMQTIESEIARLQKLPGFSKLQRNLFFNMMSALPDNSVNNVRVAPCDSRRGKRDHKDSIASKSGNGHLHLLSLGRSTDHVPMPDDEGEFVPQGLADLHGKEDPPLEGRIIKKISNLVIERDGGGWGKVLERRAMEARLEEQRLEKKNRAKNKKRIGW